MVVVKVGGVDLVPNAADPDDGGEPGGERVATEGGARVHGAHNLDSLEPHPLQLLIVEPSIRQYLAGERRERERERELGEPCEPVCVSVRPAGGRQ